MTGLLEERERRTALFAAGLAAVAAVALWGPSFEQPAAIAMAGLGVVLAGLLAAAALSRRRLPTGVAAMLLAFGPWSFAWVLGFPYLCLAAWLLFRHGRARESRPDRGEEAQPSRPRRPAKTAPARSGPVRPEANKRYTPPQRRR